MLEQPATYLKVHARPKDTEPTEPCPVIPQPPSETLPEAVALHMRGPRLSWISLCLVAGWGLQVLHTSHVVRGAR